MTYFELEKPIALHEIDANERVSAAGHYSPFSKDGDVN